jgi:hypothetical protein
VRLNDPDGDQEFWERYERWVGLEDQRMDERDRFMEHDYRTRLEREKEAEAA